MSTSTSRQFITVRVEEIILGALLGALAALAFVAPIIMMIVGPFAGWLALLHPLSGGTLFHEALRGLALLAVLAGAIAGGWFAVHQEAVEHVRGAQFFADPDEAAGLMAAREWQRMSAAQRSGEIRGIVIGGVELARRTEVEHILDIGQPGSGKTEAFAFPLIDQAMARGDRLLIHDVKGDITAARYDDSTCVLLGPWDNRAAIWDAAADFATPALIDEFAATVCDASAEKSGQNLSFHRGAAQLLGGLMRRALVHGKSWSWTDLAADLTLPPVALAQRAVEGDARVGGTVPRLVHATGPTVELGTGEAAYFSILSGATQFVAQMAAVERARPDARRFSIRRWMLDEDANVDGVQVVILNNNAQYATISKAIFGAVLRVLSSLVSSAAMPEVSPDEPGTWLVIDEGASAGGVVLRELSSLAAVGRSRGVRVVLGIQDEDQLAAEMGGIEQARPLLAMQGLRYYVRPSPRAAAELVRLVGEREIKRLETTANAGAVQGKTATIDRVPVLTTGDLTGLRALKKDPRARTVNIDFVAYIGDQLFRLVYPATPARAPRAPAYIASAAWERGNLPMPPAASPVIAAAAQPVADDAQPIVDHEPQQHDDAGRDDPDDFKRIFDNSNEPEVGP